MELRHIRYFLAVAEERNFTRAAARVGIGQPPLSQQIKDLEAEVGTALFHRVPHGAELTEAGRAFLEVVRLVPAQTDRAIRAAQKAARGEVGSLRIGFTGSAAFNPVVASAIRSFRRAYPQVDLTFDEANSTSLITRLREGELDAVFVRSALSEANDLNQRVVFEEPILVVLPSRHPLAKLKKIDLKRLRNDALILTPRAVGQSLFDIVVSACRRAGFEPILGQSAPQIGSVVGLVAAELGVSLVPASMRQLQVPGVTYCEIKGRAPTAWLELVWRRGETSKAARNFVAGVADRSTL
jgi:DNA-binding transcriptional LysR family regulator